MQVFHHHEGTVLLILAEIVDAENVVVPDVACHAGLGQKAGLGIRVLAALSVRILTATVRPMTVSRARYTCDMPPPRNSSNSYFPMRAGSSI